MIRRVNGKYVEVTLKKKPKELPKYLINISCVLNFDIKDLPTEDIVFFGKNDSLFKNKYLNIVDYHGNILDIISNLFYTKNKQYNWSSFKEEPIIKYNIHNSINIDKNEWSNYTLNLRIGYFSSINNTYINLINADNVCIFDLELLSKISIKCLELINSFEGGEDE